MKYRNNSSIKIYFVWQLIGTIIDVGISLLLFLGGKALFNWLNSIFSDVSLLSQFLIVAFGYIGGVIAAIVCAAAAIGTLVELFNGDIEFYVEKTLKPSKTFVITEKNGNLSLYFKKWWGTYYEWNKEIKTKDPAQLSYDYKQFLKNNIKDSEESDMNVIFRGRA